MNNLTKENLLRIEGHLHILLGHAITNPGRIRKWVPSSLNGEIITIANYEDVSTEDLQKKIRISIQKCIDINKIFILQIELNSLGNQSSSSVNMDDIRMQDDEYHASKSRSYNHNIYRKHEIENNISELESIYKLLSLDVFYIMNMINNDKLLECEIESFNKTWKNSLDALKVMTGN